MDSNLWTIIIAVLASLITVAVAEIGRRQYKALGGEMLGVSEREKGLVAEIIHLRDKVAEQDRKNAELESRLKASDRKIEELKSQISGLTLLYNKALTEIQRSVQEGTAEDIAHMEVPLLYICGPDRLLCATDRNSLRKANVPFRRIENATTQQIARELTRRRLDGTMYRWMHIAAHMGPSGIALDGTIMTAEALSDMVEGIEVLVLSGCESVDIADSLVGIVDVVISVREAVDNDIAGNFGYSFWRRMMQTNDVSASYDRALKEVPEIREYVDIRGI